MSPLRLLAVTILLAQPLAAQETAPAAVPDAPPALWVQGEISVLARPLIAVVGARNASSLGLRMARGLALALSEAGIGVTAGLARGIDAAAHEGALSTGTVAVLGGGVDDIYPPDHRDLYARIADQGCIVSESAVGARAQARAVAGRSRRAGRTHRPGPGGRRPAARCRRTRGGRAAPLSRHRGRRGRVSTRPRRPPGPPAPSRPRGPAGSARPARGAAGRTSPGCPPCAA